MSNEARKRAEAYSLTRTNTALLGKPLAVKWIPEGSDDLGFTNGTERSVYVAWEHEYFEGMEEREKSMMRMGVDAHELLHQIFTNFSYTNYLCDKMTQYEARVFMMFANTLEDAAIEYQAPNAFTGLMLDALRFSIVKIYQKTPPLDESKDAFGQLVNALIQFGDMAIIKGNFTFPESYEYFKKVAPLYNKGIVEPDNAKRLDIAKECMEITRPLWEPMVKEKEDFMKFIEELLKEFASAMEDAGLNLEGLFEPGEGGKSVKSDRREELLEKMADSSDGADSSDSDESEEGEASDGASSDVGTESDKDGESASSSKGSSKKATSKSSSKASSKGNSDSASDSDSDSSAGNPKGKADNITSSADNANMIAEEEVEITEDMLREVEKQIAQASSSIERESSESTEGDVKDFSVTSPRWKSASCLNRKIKVANKDAYVTSYMRYLSPLQSQINVFSKALLRLLKDDSGEMQRRTSGKYNIRRGEIGCSAKIFDKRKLPGDPHDIAVTIIVDESGSMGIDKMEQARKACIILTETFAKVNIPVYVLGFRADQSGYDAVHDVYVGWKNTLAERSSLMQMSAGGNNFDGYSVRYGGKVLNDSGAARQILFVISDGQPACHTYGSDGIADTADAIREVRKSGAIVFGIGIGYCGPEILMSMYGKDFIHCEDERLLASTIEKKLKKIIKTS